MMKKIIYLSIILLMGYACRKEPAPMVDYYRIALESEVRLDSIEQEYVAADSAGTLTPEREKQLDAQWDTQYEQVIADYAAFFEHHINDSIGQAIFATTSWGQRRLSIVQLETILAKADSVFQATELYKRSAERLARMKLSSPGSVYQDIVSKTPDGKEAKLSDYVGKGKYVLIDFWASWCGPCRKEMPHLIELYRQYQDKKFEIVGYSLDRDEKSWKKGIADLQIPWPQLSDCEFWESLPVQIYDVHGIPNTVLIDPDGIIVEKGLTGDKLAATLQKIVQ